MRLRSLDLNLLVVFDAVARERSVTRAAARLNMTQPAISHALGRLRSTLGDALFVRTPDGMDATPFARRLAEPIQDALHSLTLAVESAEDFDPPVSSRSFHIGVNNRAAVALATPVSKAVMTVAPDVRLVFRPSGTLDLEDCLDCGELDLAVGGWRAANERFRDLHLFDDPFVAVVQRGHPGALEPVISLDTLARYPHLALSSTGEDASFVDRELERHGLARKVVLHASLLCAPSLLASTQMITILAERTAREFARMTPLNVLQLPFEPPRLQTVMLWHRRVDNLASHRWLRDLIAGVARTLAGQGAAAKQPGQHENPICLDAQSALPNKP